MSSASSTSTVSETTTVTATTTGTATTASSGVAMSNVQFNMLLAAVSSSNATNNERLDEKLEQFRREYSRIR